MARVASLTDGFKGLVQGARNERFRVMDRCLEIIDQETSGYGYHFWGSFTSTFCSLPPLAKFHLALASTQPLSWIKTLNVLIIRKGGLTSRNRTISIPRHWQNTTFTALCQRLHHTHPRSAACVTYVAQIYNPNV